MPAHCCRLTIVTFKAFRPVLRCDTLFFANLFCLFFVSIVDFSPTCYYYYLLVLYLEAYSPFIYSHVSSIIYISTYLSCKYVCVSCGHRTNKQVSSSLCCYLVSQYFSIYCFFFGWCCCCKHFYLNASNKQTNTKITIKVKHSRITSNQT